jgi:hypothetical protein
MTISIEAYDKKQFNKHGRIKKNAKRDFEKNVTVENKESVPRFYQEVAITLKRKYFDFTKPYIFSCIIARSMETGEEIRIYEHVNGLITSPTELQGLLKNQ